MTNLLETVWSSIKKYFQKFEKRKNCVKNHYRNSGVKVPVFKFGVMHYSFGGSLGVVAVGVPPWLLRLKIPPTFCSKDWNDGEDLKYGDYLSKRLLIYSGNRHKLI